MSIGRFGSDDEIDSLRDEYFEDRPMACSGLGDDWSDIKREYELMKEEGAEEITLQQLKERLDASQD